MRFLLFQWKFSLSNRKTIWRPKEENFVWTILCETQANFRKQKQQQPNSIFGISVCFSVKNHTKIDWVLNVCKMFQNINDTENEKEILVIIIKCFIHSLNLFWMIYILFFLEKKGKHVKHHLIWIKKNSFIHWWLGFVVSINKWIAIVFFIHAKKCQEIFSIFFFFSQLHNWWMKLDGFVMLCLSNKHVKNVWSNYQTFFFVILYHHFALLTNEWKKEILVRLDFSNSFKWWCNPESIYPKVWSLGQWRLLCVFWFPTFST